jgi:hypothetical protein
MNNIFQINGKPFTAGNRMISADFSQNAKIDLLTGDTATQNSNFNLYLTASNSGFTSYYNCIVSCSGDSSYAITGATIQLKHNESYTWTLSDKIVAFTGNTTINVKLYNLGVLIDEKNYSAYINPIPAVINSITGATIETNVDFNLTTIIWNSGVTNSFSIIVSCADDSSYAITGSTQVISGSTGYTYVLSDKFTNYTGSTIINVKLYCDGILVDNKNYSAFVNTFRAGINSITGDTITTNINFNLTTIIWNSGLTNSYYIIVSCADDSSYAITGNTIAISGSTGYTYVLSDKFNTYTGSTTINVKLYSSTNVLIQSSNYSAYVSNLDYAFWANCVGYFKFDATGGTTVTDSVSGLTGSTTNTWNSSGKNNYCSAWNGSQLCTISTNSNLKFSSNYSISLWLYISAISGDQFIIQRAPYPTYDYVVWAQSYNSNTQVRMYFRSNGVNDLAVPVGDVFNLNEWHHIVVSNGTTYRRIYIDGTKRAEGARYVGASDNANYFGNYSGTGYGLNGRLDEVAFWNVELDSTSITSLAAGKYYNLQ